MTRRQFSREFKREAVHLVVDRNGVHDELRSIGEYRAVMDVPANDAAPALLLSGNGGGWRVARAQ
jgi:hypothetical protein